MRSAEFDREQVLRNAMTKFVEKGYGKTSMQDLKAATGLHPGSIYCAFENKRGLLIAALEQYSRDSCDAFNALFNQFDTVKAGLSAYLDAVLQECVQEQVQDCLLQKALSELSHQDAEVEALISARMNRWHDALITKVQEMQQKGETANDRNAEHLGQFLVMGIYGLRTMSHTRPGYAVMKRLRDDLFAYVTEEKRPPN